MPTSWTHWNSFHPDLIITDYNLPDIDGLTAVRLVRQRDAEVPVVLVTGVLEDEAAVMIRSEMNDSQESGMRVRHSGPFRKRALFQFAAVLGDVLEDRQPAVRDRRSLP